MIERCVETFPPAKINLFLEVVAKRGDGFHELDTVMLAVDLRDSLRVQLISDPVILLECRWLPGHAVKVRRMGGEAVVSCLDVPKPESNLVYRALAMFRDEFSVAQGFSVQLDKRIPAGAGMGGASSDAAAALSAAARLCGVESEHDRLLAIAAVLGSDIPFFLGRSTIDFGSSEPSTTATQATPFNTAASGRVIAARGRGRGELLECFSVNSRLHFVIVYPPEPLSTPAVYKHCTVPAETVDASECCRILYERRPAALASHLHNRLSEPASKLSRWIDKTMVAIRLAGLKGVTMTGSGSACFGLAPSARVAMRTANRLSSRGIGVCFATKSDRLPSPIRVLT